MDTGRRTYTENRAGKVKIRSISIGRPRRDNVIGGYEGANRKQAIRRRRLLHPRARMKIRGQEKRIGKLAALLIRIIGSTLRVDFEDRCGAQDPANPQRMIWTFWHNRMFVIPLLPMRYIKHRTGAALTSASKDGDIIASVMESLHLKSVRGSSSRGGTAALLALGVALAGGDDVAITPDGPRGPIYKLGRGVVYLAQETGAGILPIHVEYSRALRLKSWDRFMIPLPFSRVRIILDNLIFIPAGADMEAERVRIEQLMQPVTK
jgi:lysophospholipid acyltransferase (LPLAT)-like uncharacterized protein